MSRRSIAFVVSLAIVVGVGWVVPTSATPPQWPSGHARVEICENGSSVAVSLRAAASRLRRGEAALTCDAGAEAVQSSALGQAVDLAVTKEVFNPVATGSVSYTIRVAKPVFSPSADAFLSDVLGGVGPLDILTFTTTQGSCFEASATQLLCDLGLLLTDPVTVTLTISCGGPPGSPVTNTANVGAPGDVTPTNNTAIVGSLCGTASTAVALVRLSAVALEGRVVVRWRTASELDAVGFNVWRTGSGATRKINRSLVRARGLGGVGGASYEVSDRRVRAGALYVYRLQVVNVDGTRTSYGTVRVRIPR